jgi:HAE1 family hydrophobic/amphiphilic exporter-1
MQTRNILMALILFQLPLVAVAQTVELQVEPRIGIDGTAQISLDEVVQGVLANQADIAVSRVAKNEAKFDVRNAQGAYDPQVGLTAYHLRQVQPVSSILGGSVTGSLTTTTIQADPQISGLSPWLGGSYKLDFSSERVISGNEFNILNPIYQTSANLNITQPLLRGFLFDQHRHLLQVSRKNVRMSDEQLRLQVITVVTQAIQAYWQLDFAHRNLKVQIEAVHLAEQQDESNRRQLAQGLLSNADVIQSQTQIATYRQNVSNAQEALTNAENTVKALMLQDRHDPLWGAELIPETQVKADSVVPSVQEAEEQALKDRPEIKLNEIAAESNRLDLRLDKDLAKPQVDFVGTFTSAGLSGKAGQLGVSTIIPGLTIPPPPSNLIGGYGQSLSNLANGKYPTVQVGLQVSLPIRNRSASSQVSIATAEGIRIKAQRRQVEMTVESDVRNALQEVASTKTGLAAATLARSSAEAQYESELRQFRAGTSTVFLVLQRQTELTSARTRELRAESDLGIAFADLDRATAATIEAQNITLQ